MHPAKPAAPSPSSASLFGQWRGSTFRFGWCVRNRKGETLIGWLCLGGFMGILWMKEGLEGCFDVGRRWRE